MMKTNRRAVHESRALRGTYNSPVRALWKSIFVAF